MKSKGEKARGRLFANKMRSEESTKILMWNIAGIAKIVGLRDLLINYDIVALQETWLEKDREGELRTKLDRSFDWTFKAAVRVKNKGRAKGGVAVGIRRGIEVQAVVEWEYGLVIQGLEVEKKRQVDLIVVYNNAKMDLVIDKMNKIAEKSIDNGKALIVMGDLNARIADWQIGKEGEREKTRNSCNLNN